MPGVLFRDDGNASVLFEAETRRLQYRRDGGADERVFIGARLGDLDMSLRKKRRQPVTAVSKENDLQHRVYGRLIFVILISAKR